MKRTIEFEDNEWDEAFGDASAQLEQHKRAIEDLETEVRDQRELRDIEADRYLTEIARKDKIHGWIVTVLVVIAAILGFSLVVLAECMVWP